MVSRLTALALIGCATGVVRAEIDFTPIPARSAVEGGYAEQVSFRETAKGHKVLYSPPAGWRLEAGTKRLHMVPTAGLADATITARPHGGIGVGEVSTMRALQVEMTAELPREAQAVKWEDLETNTLLMNTHETRRLTVSFEVNGQLFRSTSVLCHFQHEAVRFGLTAREVDFEKLYGAFRESLFTWSGLP